MANTRQTPEERKKRGKPTPTICGVEIKPEKWTWQQAEAALAKNVANRHMRESVAGQYERLMGAKPSLWGAPDAKQGYRASAQFVIFDWDGNLLDGQHRLYGQVLAKVSLYHYVLRDVPPSTQRYVDIGAARLASDGLKLLGYANYTILSTTARWSWLLEHEMTHNRRIKVSPDEIYDMVERYPDLEHSAAQAAYVERVPSWKYILGPTPIGAAHWWIAQTNGHYEADLFFDRFMHLNGEPDGSAIWALWNRLTTAHKDGEFIRTRIEIAMLLKAWNLDVARGFVKRLPSKGGRGGELTVPEVALRTESQEDGNYGPLPELTAEDEDTEEVEDEEDTAGDSEAS